MRKVATATSWAGGCKIGTGEVFVIAIGSRSCGDTLETDFGKRLLLGMKKAATGTAFRL